MSSSDLKLKQLWTVEETNCLLALWSSAEIQGKLEGATRTKPVFEQIRHEMALAGFERTSEQISNKLKKLKKEYRDQMMELGRNGRIRPRRNPYFEILDSVLGNRTTHQAAEALDSETAELVVVKDETLSTCSEDPELCTMDDTDLQPTLLRSVICSSPTPSCSSTTSSQAPLRVNDRKRKRDRYEEMLQYLEWADGRFLQHSKATNAETNALLQRLVANSEAMLSIMSRMLSVMEAQAHK